METTNKKIESDYRKKIGLGEIHGQLRGEDVFFKIRNIERKDILYQILGGELAQSSLQIVANSERTRFKVFGTFADVEDAIKRYNAIINDIDNVISTMWVDVKAEQTSHKPKKNQTKTGGRRTIKKSSKFKIK